MPITRHPLLPRHDRDRVLTSVEVDLQAVMLLHEGLRALRSNPGLLGQVLERRLRGAYPALVPALPPDRALAGSGVIDWFEAVVGELPDVDRVRGRLLAMKAWCRACGLGEHELPALARLVCDAMIEAGGEGWSAAVVREWSQATDIGIHLVR